MTEMWAHGFKTALEVVLEPHPDEHCPYFGGWLEVWLITPLTVGLCTVTGEACHMGQRWTKQVCTHNRPCPFKNKVGDIPELDERYLKAGARTGRSELCPPPARP